MSDISRWLITFLLNAVWQITATAALAALCAKLLQPMPSRYAHVVWGLALVGCLLVPLTTVFIQVHAGAATDTVIKPASVAIESGNHASRGRSVPLHSLSRSVPFPSILIPILLWAYGALLFYRVMRLIWASWRTAQIRRSACARPLPASLSRVAERGVRAFSLPAIPVLSSREVAGPATIGFRKPVLILPESFLAEGFL